MESIVHTVFLFLHFYFSGCTDLNDCDTASQTCNTFCKVGLVVFGFGRGELSLKSLDMLVYGFLIGCTVDDNGMVTGNLNSLGITKDFLGNRVGKLNTCFVGNNMATGKQRDVAEIVLPGFAVARSLDSYDL